MTSMLHLRKFSHHPPQHTQPIDNCDDESIEYMRQVEFIPSVSKLLVNILPGYSSYLQKMADQNQTLPEIKYATLAPTSRSLPCPRQL